MPPDQRPKYVLFISIFVLALLIRIAGTAQFVGLNSPPDRNAGGLDIIDYEQFAYHMSIGKGYSLPDGQPTARRAPGTSLAILLPYLALGRNYTAAHLLFCVMSALTCVAAAWMADLAFGRTEAILSGLGMTFYPGSAYYSMHFFSEVPSAMWLCLACALTISAFTSRKSTVHLAAGICWGIAVLTRPQIVLLVPLGWMLVILPRSFRRSAVLRGMAIQTAVLVAVIAPWVARNAVVMGKATLGTVVGGVTFWGANNEFVASSTEYRGLWYFGPEVWQTTDWLEAKTELEQDATAWRHGKEFVKDHLADMPGLTVAKLWRLTTPFQHTANRAVYWGFALSWLTLIPAVLVGVPLAFRNALWPSLVVSLPVVVTLATAVVFYGNIRIRDGVAPFLIVFGAVAVARLIEVVWPRDQTSRAK